MRATKCNIKEAFDTNLILGPNVNEFEKDWPVLGQYTLPHYHQVAAIHIT